MPHRRGDSFLVDFDTVKYNKENNVYHFMRHLTVANFLGITSWAPSKIYAGRVGELGRHIFPIKPRPRTFEQTSAPDGSVLKTRYEVKEEFFQGHYKNIASRAKEMVAYFLTQASPAASRGGGEEGGGEGGWGG